MKPFAIGMVLLVVVGACAKNVKPRNDMLHDISWAQNLFALYEYDRLSFTFTVQLPDKVVRRHWDWYIQDNRILLDGVEQAVSQAFINDIYWLLFPLKANEGRDQVEVAVNRDQISPLTERSTTEVVVRYVGGKGYTPDDTYKLYVDDNLMVREWSYLKGGQEPPARMTTWSDYRTIGRMELSLLREGRDGFRVWFTDVEVE